MAICFPSSYFRFSVFFTDSMISFSDFNSSFKITPKRCLITFSNSSSLFTVSTKDFSSKEVLWLRRWIISTLRVSLPSCKKVDLRVSMVRSLAAINLIISFAFSSISLFSIASSLFWVSFKFSFFNKSLIVFSSFLPKRISTNSFSTSSFVLSFLSITPPLIKRKSKSIPSSFSKRIFSEGK